MMSLDWKVDEQCYLSALYGTGITMVNRMITRLYDLPAGDQLPRHRAASPDFRQSAATTARTGSWSSRDHFFTALMGPPATRTALSVSL